MSPPADLDGLPATELKALVLELLGEVSALKQVVAEQRAEIQRLKGLKGPPSIKPSGMEQASEAKPPAGHGKRRGRGAKRITRVAVEDRVLTADVPAGSRFKSLPSRRRGATRATSFRIWCYGRLRSGSGASAG